MNKNSSELARKRAIFDILEAATVEDDEDEDDNEIAAFLRTSTACTNCASQSLPSRQAGSNQSFELHLNSSAIGFPSSGIEPASSSPAINQPGNIPAEFSPGEPQATRGQKRKRLEDATLPNGLQVFKGLVFYFFPNDDVAPARKARILKAVERGALWEKGFNESVSHVIVDRGLTYGDVLKYLKVTMLPDDVVVVNESYPSSCMVLNQLLNPDLLQHRVKGQPGKGVEKSVCGNPKSPLRRPHNGGKAQSPTRPEGDERVEAFQDQGILAKALATSSPAAVQVVDSSNTLSGYSLDEAIKDAHAVQDLPLDSDDDESSNQDSFQSPPEPSANGEIEGSPSSSSVLAWQQRFACMNPSVNSTSKSNARTIEILQQMATHYDRVNDHWRTTAYRKAISILKRQSGRISTKAEALAMSGIGDRLADKIEEIVQTDNLRFLQNAAEDPLTKALKTFLGIYQVGSNQASAWVSQGFRTLEDLVTSEVELTPNQRVGLEHYDHFNQRIPREEMNRHADFVKRVVAEIDNGIETAVVGSYRRGSQDSGDVDFIVASPENMSLGTLRTIFFDSIIPRLYSASYLKYALVASSARSDSTKWHGACALPSSSDSNPPWRRIDFLLVPYQQLGAAMIYSTGNDLFNRSMRLLARKKGMRLNQRGLWKGVEGGPSRKGGEGGKGGTLIAQRNERDIFELLGVQWREPMERNV